MCNKAFFFLSERSSGDGGGASGFQGSFRRLWGVSCQDEESFNLLQNVRMQPQVLNLTSITSLGAPQTFISLEVNRFGSKSVEAHILPNKFIRSVLELLT